MIKKFLQSKEKHISKKEFDDLDFKQLKLLNDCYYKTNSAIIDDTTWHDLDMKNVFAKLNYTVTTPGEERLYSWLRNPIDNQVDLEQRIDYINKFKNNKTTLQKLRKNLAEIKYFKFDFREVINNTFVTNYFMLVIFIIAALINLGIITYSLIIKELFAFPILILVFIINMVFHFKFSKNYGKQLQTLSYTLKLLSFTNKNKKLLEEVRPELAQKLEKLNDLLKGIKKKGNLIFRIEGLDLIGDYINILFLVKEISFLLASKHINKYKQEIIEVYEIIGVLDAVLSINCFRNDLAYYCEPDINNNQEEIHIVDMYHPLLDDPVSNSINITNSIALTGSNMSGKSTFLRSVALNTLFAQSICTSLAREHRTKFYRVVTTISLNDDILHGKSYYLREAEAIKRMVDLKDDDYSTLVIIDEIFKGTNPVERLAAAVEILNTLASGNTKTLVATHDLEILPELVDYEYYYFTEQVTNDSLEFDYKLRKGVATTRNAVKILELINYPEKLISKINKRIERIEI